MRNMVGKTATSRLRTYCSFLLILTLVSADVFVFLEHGFSRAPEARAASGDFSVFRENTGGTVIAGTGNSLSWDTTVSESTNIALDVNDTDITLSDGGKYLVMYNAYTEEGTQGGNNRRSVASYLTLDGTPLEYGWGAGYIRDSDADLTAYNSGAAIIDAAADQKLRVVLDRDDANASGGTEVRDATNGVSVLKLDDSLDYLRVHLSARSSDISANTSFTDVTWDTADEVDVDSFGFTPSSADVTVKGTADQLFLVTANVKLNNDDTGGQRQNYEMRFTLDGVEIPGTRTTTYLRFDNGHINGTMQYVGIIKKTASGDQTFNVEVRRESQAADSTDIVGDETALAMVALPAGAEVISLSHDATQTLTSAQSVMNWNTQLVTSPTYFLHSTTTANDDITIQSDGDYAFFATTYTTRTSGTGRDVPKLDWRIDGAVQNFGGHGSYNRGDEGTEDTYTSGASGGAIFAGLSNGEVIDLVQSDETGGTPVADFGAELVALQAVELTSLVPAASTDVSVSGTQPATTSPAVSNVELGEQFAIVENDSSRNVTNVTFTETGTVNAAADLSNVRIYYDLDTSNPYNCASESYSGAENQFGATSTFSGANGTVSFTDSVSISTTQALCVYMVFDIGAIASDGETINVLIDNPSVDVVVTSGGTVSPTGQLGGSFTTIEEATITQTGYHWRNDDGSEAAASSATGGVENTPALSFSTTTPQRLRIGVAASGTGGETNSYRIEYAEKVTTCDAATGWTDVGAGGGAWDMFDSSFLAEGANTTNIAVSTGGVTDGAENFIVSNGGIRDASSQTGAITLDDVAVASVAEFASDTVTNGVTTTIALSNTYTNPVVVASARYPRTGTQRTTRISNKTSTSFDVLIDNYNGTLGVGTSNFDYLVIEAGDWTVDDGGSGTHIFATTTTTSVVDGRALLDNPGGALVTYPTSFTNPTVLASISTANDPDWAFAQVYDGTNVDNKPGGSSLTAFLNENWNEDGHTAAEDIDIIVFEEGTGTNNSIDFSFTTSGSANVSNTPISIGYGRTYGAAPSVILLQALTQLGSDGGYALVDEDTAPTASAATLSTDEDGEDGTATPADRAHAAEEVAVITFESDGDLIITRYDQHDFVELEYSLRATDIAVEGVAYCFRVSSGEGPSGYYPGYTDRIALTIPSANIDADVTDFPVYVDLSDLGSNFWAGVESDGRDIRITDSSGVTEVAYDLVSINTGGESGELYFKAASLSSSNDNTFYIYYNNPAASAYAATDEFGSENVWTRYEAVYHLDESGATYLDSTGNSYDGVGEATDPSLTTGILGGAQDFAANGRIDIGNGMNAALIAAGEYQISAWINLDTSTGDQSPVSQYSGAGDFLLWADTGGAGTGFCHYNGSYMPSNCQDLNNQNVGNWQHLAAYHDGANGGIYLDGVETGTGPTASTFGVDAALRFAIGSQNGDSTLRQFNGQIDEVRIAASHFGEAWADAEFQNQSNPSGFYSTGTVSVSPNTVSYDEYPEATLSADVTVSATGTQIATVNSGTDDVVIGGAFSIISNNGSRTVTGLTITETGTIDASQYLSNPRIAIDFDTSPAYDCSSESYGGGETTFSGTAFSDPNGTSTVSGGGTISTTQAICAYVLVDVASTTPDGETIEFEITAPNNEVIVTSSTVGPGSAIALDGTTVVQSPSFTQANYHWRNDDGNETGATSASGGVENTPISQVFQGTNRRLRVAVSNDGGQNSVGFEPRLEYGTKVTTCENIGSWERVDTGIAFEMASTSQLSDGSDTTQIPEGDGGVSNPNTVFLSPNSAQEETADQLVSTALDNDEYIEIEYALQLTDASAFSATYCFRVTDAGVPFDTYTNYPELTTQERQDFFIQRGTETVSGTGITLTAGSDYTAPASTSSAFVRITNTSMTGAGSDTLGQTRTPDELTAYIEVADLTSSFTITRPPTADDNTRVSWEIIEYIGVAGADNEFKVRDASTVTYGASSLFATGTTLSNVSDDSDVVVFITGQYNPAGSTGDYNTGLSISSWSPTSSAPVFERGDADSVAARVSYAVVEFTGASWNVQRAEHTFTAAGVTETENIAAVNSLLRTFVHAQKLSGDELFNLDESGHEVWLSSIGAVSFVLESGSTNPSLQRSVAWVIENTQTGDGAMNVYRSNGLIAATTTQPTAYVYEIGQTVTPENATIWANNRSTGGGSAHPRALLGARILNETQFELWKSDEGQNQNFRVEIVDWPVAETSIRQTHYRFYVDNDALTPTDPWPAGATDLGENTAMTDLDEPLGEGERTRIRAGLFINNASLVADSVSFKLQYARRVSTCSAVSVWDDVGAPGSGEIWRGYDAAPADGTELAGGVSLLLSVSDVAGTYEESSPSEPNPNSIDIAEYVEYDWIVENNGALQKSSYCFRMVESDGAVLDGYDVYPTVRTSGYTPVIDNWRWYTDQDNETPSTALAGERVAPSAVAVGEELKLRVSVTEIEGAPGNNIKFNLQYAEYPDFRDAVTLTATTSCTGGTLWCYADGAGDDDQVISTTTLSGVDACTLGVGNGCGTHNEAEGLIGVYDQPAFTTSEHEFTLKHDGARVNAVYYFRLVDATNGSNLVASSSYPSLTTEGAVLTFAVSGIDAGQSIEGVTTDATTTATDIDFGSLPINTDVEAAQRLTVFTNGTQGYRVFLDFSQDMLDSYGNPIANIPATNEVPATWESQCTGATTGCFGYHAGDDTLYDGSLRFTLDNTYAGIESGPVEIMASNIPVTFDVSDIVYRTRVDYLQPAGSYNTSLQYIIVPIF